MTILISRIFDVMSEYWVSVHDFIITDINIISGLDNSNDVSEKFDRLVHMSDVLRLLYVHRVTVKFN